ncbi:MAG: hypothetical protein HGB10_05480 [Coriobacteriia bacterium]|nr:hypothetical protein [Coriobacteriia bacterium]
MSTIEEIRQRVWDFWLTIVTVAVLAALGVQSFIGTGYVWWAQRAIPEWEAGPGYAAYVELMNLIAAPLVLVLVLVMGLCVPKRLFSRRALILVSGAMVAAGMIAWAVTGKLETGLAIYLSLAAIIQVAVVVLTVAGVRGPSYLTEGRLTKTGSGLLHLGFVLFGIVVVALQRSSWMMPVFSAAAIFSLVGTVLAFYASRLAWHRSTPREETAFEWSDEPDYPESPKSVSENPDSNGSM